MPNVRPTIRRPQTGNGATRRAPSGSRSGAAAGRPRLTGHGGGPLDLAAAIAIGLRALADLRAPSDEARNGRLEQMLRTSLEQHRTPTRTSADGDTPAADAAVSATRTACAYLAARDFEDAYFALRTAHDFLPRGR